MNEPHSSVPLLLGHGSEHVVRVHEVQEDEGTPQAVNFCQKIVVRESVCVLIEETVPCRRRFGGIKLPRFAETLRNQFQ